MPYGQNHIYQTQIFKIPRSGLGIVKTISTHLGHYRVAVTEVPVPNVTIPDALRAKPHLSNTNL